MAVEFQTKTFEFDDKRGTSRWTATSVQTFSRPVVSAEVAISGFKLEYVNKDHHVRVAEVDANVARIRGVDVSIEAHYQFADQNYDDRYSGYVRVLIIAQLLD